ncbi:hypothetical protein IID24_00125 [Patescibacteria group bacterium]|nr:hypothetical protein [Patescibacteria group bacterium]
MNVERGNFEQREVGAEKIITREDLMTFEKYEEWGREYWKKEGEKFKPYEYEIIGESDKRLSYFGVEHSNDPDNPMYGDEHKEGEIRNAFRDVRPQKVYVEGMHGLRGNKEEEVERIRAMSYEETIREYGEPGFTAKLAIENNSDVESPEPDFRETIEYLLGQGFSKEEIFVHFFYLMVPEYQRMKKEDSDKNFRELIDRHIEEISLATKWEGFDYSYEHAVEIGKNIFLDRKFDPEDEFYQDRVGPFLSESHKEEETVINRISQEFNYFRDVYIVNQIREELEDTDRIFVVYGETHAVMQRPALEKIIAK